MLMPASLVFYYNVTVSVTVLYPTIYSAKESEPCRRAGQQEPGKESEPCKPSGQYEQGHGLVRALQASRPV
jgi:hypothetical protein